MVGKKCGQIAWNQGPLAVALAPNVLLENWSRAWGNVYNRTSQSVTIPSNSTSYSLCFMLYDVFISDTWPTFCGFTKIHFTLNFRCEYYFFLTRYLIKFEIELCNFDVLFIKTFTFSLGSASPSIANGHFQLQEGSLLGVSEISQLRAQNRTILTET